MMTKAFDHDEGDDEGMAEGAGGEGKGSVDAWITAADSTPADGEASLSASRSGEARLGDAESVFFSAGSGKRGFIRQETFAYVVDSCALEIR
jgi:hypothetical protein